MTNYVELRNTGVSFFMHKQIAIDELESIMNWLKLLESDVLQKKELKDLLDKLVNLVAICQANYKKLCSQKD